MSGDDLPLRHYFPQPTDRTAVNDLLDIGTRSSWIGTRSSWRGVYHVLGNLDGELHSRDMGIAPALHEAGLVTATSTVIGVMARLALPIV